MGKKGIGARLRKLRARYLNALPFWRRDFDNVRRYGWQAPLSAQRLFINPREVVQYVNWGPGFTRADSGRVCDGDWDLKAQLLESCEKVAVVNRKLEQSLTWEAAGAYARMLRVIARRPGTDGCYSLDDIKERYLRLDEVIACMEREGRLRTRTELNRLNFREMGGVLVHIGRTGEPIFGCGGAHRLVAARYLGFSVIPCQVGVVHEEALKNGAFARLRCRKEETA